MFSINGKQVDTLSDEALVGAMNAKSLLKDGVLEFSLADNSTAPFSWMVEGGVEANDIGSATEYVKAFVKRDCNVYNYSSLNDDDLTAAIMELGLVDDVISYIAEWKRS